jgi:hypothetical protein
MTSRVLVALPDQQIRRLLWDDPRVVILDDEGWWILDSAAGQRRLAETFSFQVDWSAQPDAAALIQRLKEWSPIWTRWVAHADQYELLYRSALFYVRHVQAAFAALAIGRIVITTGVSHHLETSLLEVAAASVAVPQVFLYFNPIANRLQPLFQNQSIADRHASAAVVSSYRATDDIARFRDRRASGKRPKLSYDIGPQCRWFSYGVANAAYVRARQWAARAKRELRGRSPQARFFDQYRALGFTDYVRVLDNQRRALRYLRRRVSDRPIASFGEGPEHPAVLIAAHYQPEATSFPEGGDLGNHVDIALKLRALGLPGPILYREHFASAYYQLPLVHQTLVGVARSVSYYQQLEELGCIFVDDASPLPLDGAAGRALLPVTITGTIAVERSLAGVPTVVTGHPWYKGLPGTRQLGAASSLDDLLAPARNSATSDDAFGFLERELSGTTIENAPGLGSGAPSDDQVSLAAFKREFGALMEHLHSATPLTAARGEELTEARRPV